MTSTRPSPGSRLRGLLEAGEPAPVLGVYDGLSARIGATEGFPALWASGLSMSSALGVRDSDEASWTDLLGCVARIVEAADGTPVLVDGDTGYGSFNTARRFAARAERLGAAGICLEDKAFPKMNSFVGDTHPLVPVAEFCGKLRACADVREDPGFVLVARVEALVAGAGMAEALARADAYKQAGADAVFVHSRARTVAEVAEFAEEWGGRLPLVVSPTTFSDTEPEEFAKLGVALVIWANQAMRASVTAVRSACRALLADGPAGTEQWVAPLEEVFELLDYQQLARDQRRYRE